MREASLHSTSPLTGEGKLLVREGMLGFAGVSRLTKVNPPESEHS
jgi:hypothetical protein